MPGFDLAKKFLHTRNAWRNNIHLKSKATKFVKKIKSFGQRCLVACRSIYPRLHAKLRAISGRPRPRSDHDFRLPEDFSAVYIDQLFPQQEHMAVSSCSARETGSVKIEIRSAHDAAGNLQTRRVSVESCANREKVGSDAAADRWKITQFRGVDERAEEFIAKFRHDMKLQREQSILDFQEMLRRSA